MAKWENFFRGGFSWQKHKSYKLDVPWPLEFPTDELAHLGVLVPGVERRSRGETELKIGSSGFTEGGGGGFVV